MRVLLLLAPLALLAAGCVAPDVSPASVAEPTVGAGALLRVAHAPGGAPVPLPSVVADIVSQTLDWSGPEPTMGITSDGYLFVVAMENVLRSADGGATWEVVSTLASSPTTLDPYLYVDPATDRVYSDQLYLGCSYLSWSDDRGATWLTNPAACGIPVNDHQKIVAGKPAGPVPQTPIYPSALYYAYNAIEGARVAVSHDGGVTWPASGTSLPPQSGACNGGLHGDIISDAEGALYIPKRDCDGFLLLKSTDGALTWTQTPVGADAGGSACRKNADLALDDAGNLYGVWPGKDNHLYLSTSQDKGDTWLPTSLDASPPEVNMTTMPVVVAGSPGRIAMAYYGTSDGARGPDEVNESAVWHLYVTYSTDALVDTPTFVTVQATSDPVQIGPISTNSDCASPPGSRNLLDFIDAELDAQGRLFVVHADGCIDACVTSLKMEDSRSANVAFVSLRTGPSLLADVGELLSPFAGATEHGHERALPTLIDLT